MTDLPSDNVTGRGTPSRWSDDEIERSVANLLRLGVLIAVVITLAGGIMYLAAHGSDLVNYATFHPPLGEVHVIRSTLAGIHVLDSRSLIEAGLLVLIATPIARVIVSLVGFIYQRDRIYIIITTIVLGILLLSLSGVLTLNH